MDWTSKEVKSIVEDYFKMLQAELEHRKYSKTTHRVSLSPFLNNRSKGSIEFKHQNISAVMVQLGLPYIKGYKPRSNYQQILLETITNYIKAHSLSLEKDFIRFSNEIVPPKSYESVDFENILNEELISSEVKEEEPLYRPIRTNYLEKEQNNRTLGEEGEKLVIEYEQWRLIKAGKPQLAKKIEWISKDQGDGTGYDILSKNSNGTDRFIEVKTTKLSKETPIYLTKTELSFSKLKGIDFFLYRVFNFDSKPQFFIKQGDYENYCKLQPVTYKGYF